jgi:hypothetical protein
MGASICCAEAEADTQFAIFAWLTIKKQCLIFFSMPYLSMPYLLSFLIFCRLLVMFVFECVAMQDLTPKIGARLMDKK